VALELGVVQKLLSATFIWTLELELINYKLSILEKRRTGTSYNQIRLQETLINTKSQKANFDNFVSLGSTRAIQVWLA
jgi:hypothetical protein